MNDGELAFGIPYVVDSDDADFHLEIPGLAERLERTVRAARGVIAGSRYVAEYYKRFNSNVAVIWTGTPVSHETWPAHVEREAEEPIIAWAQSRPLDYPFELEFVVGLDRRLRAAGSRHRLRLYGVDAAADRIELAKRFGFNCELLPTLDYDEFLASLREVSIGLCPLSSAAPFSRGKSFGKILAYLNAGVPIVASDAADHAMFFEPEAGVISNDPRAWDEAVLGLLANPSKRDSMAIRAHTLFRERLSLDAAASLTEQFLLKLLISTSSTSARST